MNKGKVLIVNLSKGNLGTGPAHLLGALLISSFSQAAEARRHIPEHERRDFTLYVDEFQNFATESFSSILSEARKWRLSLVAANQTISQLPDGLQHARLRQRRHARRPGRQHDAGRRRGHAERLHAHRRRALVDPDPVIGRKIGEALHQAAGPSDGRLHGTACAAQAEE